MYSEKWEKSGAEIQMVILGYFLIFLHKIIFCTYILGSTDSN